MSISVRFRLLSVPSTGTQVYLCARRHVSCVAAKLLVAGFQERRPRNSEASPENLGAVSPGQRRRKGSYSSARVVRGAA